MMRGWRHYEDVGTILVQLRAYVPFFDYFCHCHARVYTMVYSFLGGGVNRVGSVGVSVARESAQ